MPKKGNIPWNKNKKGCYSKESIRKMSEAQKGEKSLEYGKRGPETCGWKGGCEQYWHTKAWKLFGKDCCEVCGISNKDHKELKGCRLSMHNTLNPKDYTVMQSYAWSCICIKCHPIIEKADIIYG